MVNIDLLLKNTELLYSATIILGLLVGSFLNVVIYRLPIILKKQWQKDCKLFLSETSDVEPEKDQNAEEKFNLILPRSRCPHCGHTISAWENIPVISYLLLRGKCNHCSAAISPRYPLIEIFCATVSFSVIWHFGPSFTGLMAILLSWSLICLCFIDYDHQYLPDNITLPFLWLGLIVNLNGTFTDIESALIGAMAGYLILWSIYKLFKLVTGKEGMGYGDFKLLAMLGAWLGWQMLPAIILLSSIVGAFVGITLVLFRLHEKSKPIPFGPYLTAAGWLTMMWGDQINHSYLVWVGLAT